MNNAIAKTFVINILPDSRGQVLYYHDIVIYDPLILSCNITPNLYKQ